MRRLAAVLVALTMFVPSPVEAASPVPLVIGDRWIQHQDPVEQQSPDWRYGSNAYNVWRCTHAEDGSEHVDTCVHNPLDCDWDVDDNSATTGNGTLASGATATDAMCVVADAYDNFGGDDKTVELTVFAPVSTLTVRLVGDGGSWLAKPVANRNGFRYTVCHTEHVRSGFATIPDSNGGTGLPLTFTASVTAAKAARSVAVYFQTYGWLPFYTTHC